MAFLRGKLKSMDKLGFPYEKRVNIEDMPVGKPAQDYPADTVFVGKNHEPIYSDSDWEE